MTKLQLAKDEIAPMLENIDKPLSNEVTEQALEYAERADLEHPINRSPKAVAAGAIYLASMIVNEPLTQKEVAANNNVSTVAIRNAYQKIAEYEGIELQRTRKGRRNKMDSWRPRFDEVIGFGGSDE